ncbi:hypothetical protein FQN57_001956 [Myotisia sp. PD_48]|nr:hypothetical protein FQN57_001956 [Myotisia sp. PD_48]
MPRPKKPGAPEPKRRSRNGCCGEEKPFCQNCQRQGERCDYSIRLNWEGRSRKKSTANASVAASLPSPSPSTPNASSYVAVDSERTVTQPVFLPVHQFQNFQPQSQYPSQTEPLSYNIPTAVSGEFEKGHGLQAPQDSSPTSRAKGNPIALHTGTRNHDLEMYPSPPAGEIKDDNSISTVVSHNPHNPHNPPFPSPSSSVFASPGPQGHHNLHNYPTSHANQNHPFPSLRHSLSPQIHSTDVSNFDTTKSDIDQRKKPTRSNTHSYFDTRNLLSTNPSTLTSISSLPSHPSYPTTFPHPISKTNVILNNPSFLPPADSSDSSSEDAYTHFTPIPIAGSSTIPTGVNRVSVNSLLTHSMTSDTASRDDPQSSVRPSTSFQNYGWDYGRPDLDIYKNDDLVVGQSDIPTGNTSNSSSLALSTADSNHATPPETSTPRSFPRITTVFSKGGYYARPVPINIPRYLSPLPPSLNDNPINILYFHHFLNHTARILVPHDCFDNPFATVLPANEQYLVAIQDKNLMHLLLAYSASHRARLLGHAEPYTRIAQWTSGVFTLLCHALNDPNKKLSDTTLATAIMLVSLKVISPTTFEVPVRWESHLKMAREIFLARQQAQPDRAADQISSFLGRWLGYLDIFGGLSSRVAEPPLVEPAYWPLSTEQPGETTSCDKEYEIDCFSGITPRVCSLLARLGEFTHQCDNLHADPTAPPSWNASRIAMSRAEQLLRDMDASSPYNTPGRRTHHSKPVEPSMAAIDEAYRLAGLIHLHRRVFGRSAADPLIKQLVDSLVDALNQISRGGQEEVCVLFPLFTAGCESQDQQQRVEIRNRVKDFEGVGMKQIRGARKLMQRSWEKGLPWTVLANGEFLG